MFMVLSTLDQLHVGDKARIMGFNSQEVGFRRKLLALGLMPGAIVEVARHAPLGDPIQVTLRGTSVSLRKTEASIIDVEGISE